ncbi:MAG: PfkB family carbohydrate kinase [Planctomycetota bacterium]
MQYKNKIKTQEELAAELGCFRENKTVVMCQGCFDIVHPGHIRYLTFAKSKGDILIVSITSDDKVRKGHDRPYIPEELRAENLAALEFVDYVIIDDHLTPIEYIKKLKPDIFVKGSEYAGSRPDAGEKTAEERETVESYGGRMIFSPGDIVFSSTKILEIRKPYIDVDIEKIRVMLEAYGITRDHIVDTIDNFRARRVLVIGDTIVDRYTYCTTLGRTTKTPTLSVRRDTSQDFIGGAGIVALHMQALGASVKFVTIVGEDSTSAWVIRQLQDAGLENSVIVDRDRPTTLKERFWADGYKLLQVDVVENAPISLEIEEAIRKQMEAEIERCDVLVSSDFRHGLLTDSLIEWSMKLAKRCGKLVVADTQVSNRWGNIMSYAGADLICPNEQEARFALGDQDSGIIPLGRELLRRTKARSLILKLGDKGLIAFEPPILNPHEGGFPRSRTREFYPLPPFEKNVVDTVGAGDAVLSTASLSLCNGSHLLPIAFISNCAAALVVQKMGNVPITNDELLDFTTKQFYHIMGRE